MGRLIQGTEQISLVWETHHRSLSSKHHQWATQAQIQEQSLSTTCPNLKKKEKRKGKLIVFAIERLVLDMYVNAKPHYHVH